jgi:L-seryl-tRNA(Ser) seleniumtransferase
MVNNLKNIPSVDELLSDPRVQGHLQKYHRNFVVDLLREAAEAARTRLRHSDSEITRSQISEWICQDLQQRMESLTQGTLKRVINGTGVVLHTNLGRAPLSKTALDYLNQMGTFYNNLELDLEKGERGSRYVHVEELLRRLTGAEAALVVNNNAAAVLLGLNTLAAHKEVIVSRGQLIEIGGAFRIPEVMKLSGALLKEVGTTNKTYLRDYAQAIGEETGLLFAAHTSNYKIEGFTAEVALSDLVKLGQENNLPVMQDLGSGILFDPATCGLGDEPTVQQCVKAGADVITFSGDKLLGGPQAGIIVGRKEYIEAMKRNQLTRALRVDKLTIAALEATLIEYLAGFPEKNLPIIHMLSISGDELQQRAERLVEILTTAIGDQTFLQSIRMVEVEDMVGGGAYPTYRLPGFGVEIIFRDLKLETVAARLRQQDPAVLTRKQEDRMLISVRTLLEGDAAILARNICQVLRDLKEKGQKGEPH